MRRNFEDFDMDDFLLEEEPAMQFYANTAEVEATAYDMAIKFGIVSGGEATVSAVVRMSPQHAQSLAILLGRFLELYKKEVGQFELPADLVAQLKGEKK